MSERKGSEVPRQFWPIATSTGVAVGFGALLVWGFIAGRGEAALEAQREKPVKAEILVSHDGEGAPIITLSSDLQERSAIVAELPNSAPYQQQLQAYGSILDLQTFTDLSNTISNAKAQLATAEAKLAASKPAFERAQLLENKGQIVTTAQLQAAEATYRSDAAAVRAAEVQSKNAAASAYQAWGPVLGQSLSEGTPLATDLVQHKKVLVQVTLPMGVALDEPPPRASIETTTGRRVEVELVSRATRTDPKIQGVSFFYTAEAATEALPGMNVIAFLPVGTATPGIAVPASAVVWLQGKPWVYVQTAPDKFSRREIPTDEPMRGGGYFVPTTAAQLAFRGPLELNETTAGLTKDRPLVVKGAQALLSQEFSAQIQVGAD